MNRIDPHFSGDGAGAGHAPVPYGWWLSGLVLAEEVGLGLSVDTALAAEYEGALLEHGIPAGMFHTREGRFSVFIDATHLTMQPSSYEPERGSFPFGGA